MDSHYFSRAASWHRSGDKLIVHDSFSSVAPRMITMEPWYEVAFTAADGQHTIDEFVKHMSSQYDGGEPPGLRQQIYGIITKLVEEQILRLHDTPEILPPYFLDEYFAASPETRKSQMQQDGLID